MPEISAEVKRLAFEERQVFDAIGIANKTLLEYRYGTDGPISSEQISREAEKVSGDVLNQLRKQEPMVNKPILAAMIVQGAETHGVHFENSEKIAVILHDARRLNGNQLSDDAIRGQFGDEMGGKVIADLKGINDALSGDPVAKGRYGNSAAALEIAELRMAVRSVGDGAREHAGTEFLKPDSPVFKNAITRAETALQSQGAEMTAFDGANRLIEAAKNVRSGTSARTLTEGPDSAVPEFQNGLASVKPYQGGYTAEETAVNRTLRAAFEVSRYQVHNRRKDGSPDINHALEVAGYDANTRDANAIAGRMLHDIDEDRYWDPASAKPEQIYRRFGPVVAGIVSEATDLQPTPDQLREIEQIRETRGDKTASEAEKNLTRALGRQSEDQYARKAELFSNLPLTRAETVYGDLHQAGHEEIVRRSANPELPFTVEGALVKVSDWRQSMQATLDNPDRVTDERSHSSGFMFGVMRKKEGFISPLVETLASPNRAPELKALGFDPSEVYSQLQGYGETSRRYTEHALDTLAKERGLSPENAEKLKGIYFDKEISPEAFRQQLEAIGFKDEQMAGKDRMVAQNAAPGVNADNIITMDNLAKNRAGHLELSDTVSLPAYSPAASTQEIAAQERFATAVRTLGGDPAKSPDAFREAMETGRQGIREFHDVGHYLAIAGNGDVNTPMDAVRFRAGINHDTVYEHVDKKGGDKTGFAPGVKEKLSPYVDITESGISIKRNPDALFQGALTLFGMKEGQKLDPLKGQNEFLSAVYDMQQARELGIEDKYILSEMTHIQGTVPFGSAGHFNELENRLVQANKLLPAEKSLSPGEIKQTTLGSVAMANTDVANFGGEFRDFLPNSIKLLHENVAGGPANLDKPAHFQQAAGGMSGFMGMVAAKSESGDMRVFHSYGENGSVPAMPPPEELTARANIAALGEYLGANSAAVQLVTAHSVSTTPDGQTPTTDISLRDLFKDATFSQPSQAGALSEAGKLALEQADGKGLSSDALAAHLLNTLGSEGTKELAKLSIAHGINPSAAIPDRNVPAKPGIDTQATADAYLVQAGEIFERHGVNFPQFRADLDNVLTTPDKSVAASPVTAQASPSQAPAAAPQTDAPPTPELAKSAPPTLQAPSYPGAAGSPAVQTGGGQAQPVILGSAAPDLHAVPLSTPQAMGNPAGLHLVPPPGSVASQAPPTQPPAALANGKVVSITAAAPAAIVPSGETTLANRTYSFIPKISESNVHGANSGIGLGMGIYGLAESLKPGSAYRQHVAHGGAEEGFANVSLGANAVNTAGGLASMARTAGYAGKGAEVVRFGANAVEAVALPFVALATAGEVGADLAAGDKRAAQKDAAGGAGGILGGAAAGAASGFVAGPIGAAAGGLIGGVLGTPLAHKVVERETEAKRTFQQIDSDTQSIRPDLKTHVHLQDEENRLKQQIMAAGITKDSLGHYDMTNEANANAMFKLLRGRESDALKAVEENKGGTFLVREAQAAKRGREALANSEVQQVRTAEYELTDTYMKAHPELAAAVKQAMKPSSSLGLHDNMLDVTHIQAPNAPGAGMGQSLGRK